jgi:NADPH:quinone reductase-like Zn-dependent oxidoreductase
MAIEPEQLIHQEAAAVRMAALIAWQALFNAAQLQAGQTVFIQQSFEDVVCATRGPAD